MLDPRADASLDVALGAEFDGLNPVDTVVLDPNTPLVAPPGCTPFDEVAAPVAPAATETPAG